MTLQFGDLFYSEYFKSRGIVTEYKDDNNWFFILEKNPHRVLKAQAKPKDLKWEIKKED